MPKIQTLQSVRILFAINIEIKSEKNCQISSKVKIILQKHNHEIRYTCMQQAGYGKHGNIMILRYLVHMLIFNLLSIFE